VSKAAGFKAVWADVITEGSGAKAVLPQYQLGTFSLQILQKITNQPKKNF
jgi:hypothetical protein